MEKESKIPKIMTPYFTTKRNGTGLGLPIVNKIINEHLGELVIKNKRQGAEVEIWLPFIQIDEQRSFSNRR